MNKLNNNPVKFYSIAIVLFVLLLSSFLYLQTRIDEISHSWLSYTKKELTKSQHLNNAIISFGYGGFIHDFKNAVIRKDYLFVNRSQAHISQGIHSLNEFIKVAPEYYQDVALIIKIITKYQKNIAKLQQLIADDISVVAIDKQVRVDDELAVASFKRILSSLRDKPGEIIASSSIAKNKLTNLIIVMLCGVFLISFWVVLFVAYLNGRLAVQLKESDLILSCAPSAILSVDHAGLIIAANNEAMKLFGFNKQAINKLNVDELVPVESKQHHQKYRDDFQKSDRVEPMSQRDKTFYGRKLNGDVFPAKISIATHAVGGEKKSIVVVSDLSEEHRIKSDANTDSLTNIPNRRAISSKLLEVISRYSRNKTPLAICIFDIDHFKEVNDQLGHLVGDECLVKVAKILKENLRETDFIGRWGGEEFIVVLENTDRDGAKYFAEKERNSVKAHFDSIDFLLPMTVSAGVTTYIEGDDIQTLFNKADKALYLSKGNGRDRVSVI